MKDISAVVSDCLVITLLQQTPKHIKGGWSHYTNTSEPVDGNGAQNMVTVQSGFRIIDLSTAGPTRLPTVLTRPAMKEISAVNT
jgi:hypothetical protein